MPAVRHLLSLCRRSRPGLALALALLVMASSICPRGWFVCLAEANAPALVDLDHVNGSHGDRHCDECPVGHHDGNCLDLALSLIGDVQVHQVPSTPALPVGELLTVLPHVALLAQIRSTAPPAWTGEPRPTPLVRHVSLQV